MPRMRRKVTVLLPITVTYDNLVPREEAIAHALTVGRSYEYIGGSGWKVNLGGYEYRAGMARVEGV